MSRLFRPFHSLFGSGRVLSRLPAGQTVHIERVKIRRGKPATRFIGNVFKCALVFQLVVYAASPLLAVDVQDDDAAGGRQDDEAGYEEDPWFIPFPFTTKKVAGRLYKRDDPVWQEYIRIHQDERFQKKLKHHLAFLVCETMRRASGFPPEEKAALRCQAYMLYIDYPIRAPAEYERSGILITDDALAWATEPYDPDAAKRLNRILWPKPLALGLWASAKGAMAQTSRDVAGWLGLTTEQHPVSDPKRPLPQPPSPEVQKALEQLRQQTTRRPAEVNDPSSASPSAAEPPTVAPSAPHDNKATSVPSSNQVAPSERSWLQEVMASIAKSRPFRTWRSTFSRTSVGARLDFPPGSVLMTGVVELATTKGSLVIDVWAFFDPKTHMLRPMHLLPRNFSASRPEPRG